MKKAAPTYEWSDLLIEIDDPKNQHEVDLNAIVSLLSDERAKQLNAYVRNALAYTMGRFMDNPATPQCEQDFYRGAASVYRRLFTLKASLEKQISDRDKVKKAASTVGSAGY